MHRKVLYIPLTTFTEWLSSFKTSYRWVELNNKRMYSRGNKF